MDTESLECALTNPKANMNKNECIFLCGQEEEIIL